MGAISGSSTLLRSREKTKPEISAKLGGLWLGLFLSVWAWAMLAPSALVPRGPWVWFLLGAAVVSAVQFYAVGSRPVPKVWAAVVPGAVALGLILPAPFSTAAWCLAAAFVLPLFVQGRQEVSQGRQGLVRQQGFLNAIAALVWGCVFSASVLGLSALVHPLYLKVMPRICEWAPLARPAALVLKLLGWNVSLGEGRIYLSRDTVLMDFPAHLEVMFYYPTLVFLTFALVLAAFGGWKRVVLVALVCSAYGLVRYVCLTGLAVEGYSLSVYWHRWVLVTTFLPMVLLLQRLVPIRLPAMPSPAKAPSKIAVALVFAVCSVGLLAASVLLGQWSDSGVRKPGRLLIDEKHSAWTRTWPFPDTVNYGMMSTYNYSAMSELLSRYYRVTINFDRPLDDKFLSQFDVVMLKLPSYPFQPFEVQALRRFVERGGGLWMIGDHTNVFGSTVYLNQVSRQFGVVYRTDCTWDLPSRQMNVWKNDSPLPMHPLLGRMKHFELENGCTLRLPLLADDIMLTRDNLSQEASYSTEVFFPEKEGGDRETRIGTDALFGGVRFGRGRVAAFTDSTSFSTFAMPAEGRYDMVLGTMEWLNRKNLPQWPARSAFFLGVSLMAAALWLGWRSGSTVLALVVAVGVAGLAVSAAAAQLGRPNMIPRPLSRERANYLYMLRGQSAAVFENLDPSKWDPRTDPMGRRRYSTFAVNAQRLGIIPLQVDAVPEPHPGAALLLVKPSKAFEQEQLNRLKEFVHQGGSLFILADNLSDKDHAEAVANLFGVAYGPRCESTTPVSTRDGVVMGFSERPRTLRGGAPLLLDRDGKTVLAEVRFGAGLVLVFGDGQMFANTTLGHHFEIPVGDRKLVCDLEYWILRRLFGGAIAARPKPIVLGQPSVPTSPSSPVKPAAKSG
jgi:hypothetical protein